MEKEAAEELQLLGALGIVREAFHILVRSSRSKLLWALALTLLLPLSFASLGYDFFFGHLFPNINEMQVKVTIRATILRDGSLETILREGSLEWRVLLMVVGSSKWRELLVVVAAYMTFDLASSLLSTASVAYTVASIYTANTNKLKLSYVRVLSADVPMVWKRLTLTFLWRFIIFFGILVDSLLAIILPLIIFFPTIFFPTGHKFKSGASLLAFLLGFLLVMVVVFCFHMYISTVLYLTSVVSVLEDKCYGLAAIRKSNKLIKGKRTTALALLLLNITFGTVIGKLFVDAVVDGRSHGVGIAARARYGTVLLGLLCFVDLMGRLTRGVLYFVCKSYHHESIDNNSSFKVYNVGDYEPLKASNNQLKLVQA
jgi:hypothetical protein